MISFRCLNCDHKYKVSDKYAGKQAKCKKCGSTILIPAESVTSIQSVQTPPAGSVESFTETKQVDNNIQAAADIGQEYKEVLDEIKNLNNPNKGWQKNAIILLVTLFIFFRLGLINTSMSFIIALIVVLLIHEMGHLIGMRLFGYRNVKMFFIPFFGAAVSGQARNVASYKKAIVSLLGPVPGLFLGVICLIVYSKTTTSFSWFLANLFLMINFFNLLPFVPLDGGRFLSEIVFSRNRYVELVFNLLASLTLIALGWFMGFWVLGIIGLFNLITIHIPFKVAGIAAEYKETDFVESGFENDGSEISSDLPYKDIIDKIKARIPGKSDAKTIASFTQNVIEKISCYPPRVLPTLGLLGLYLFFWIMPGVFLIIAAKSDMLVTNKIIKYENTQGQMVHCEQSYALGKLSCQIDLSEDQKLYHGRGVSYYFDGSISKEKNWSNGKWDGEAKYYDEQGNLIRVAVFDEGKFVSQKELKDGSWIEQSWDDLTIDQQQSIDNHNAKPALGPE